MEKEQDSVLKRFKNNIPLIYIFLVCFGYFNKSIYFDVFDIDILNYLSIPELVLMFIPFGSILVIVALSMVIIIAPMVVFGSKIPEEELEKDNFNIKPHIDGISNEKVRNILSKGYLIISMIAFIFYN